MITCAAPLDIYMHNCCDLADAQADLPNTDLKLDTLI